MKVGTDGIMLGAWACGGKRMLDIGTGTGVIALMMAQRFPDGRVDAIDIDPDAAAQAAENAGLSPFADRVSVRCAALQDYAASAKYDSIVCNPPFFSRSLVSPDSKRTLARHSASLPFDVLFRRAAELLADDGYFSLIIPKDTLPEVETAAALSGMFLTRRCSVRTTPKKLPSRHLLTFARVPEQLTDEEGVIQNSPSEPTEWYRNLLSDFLLKF